MLGFSTIPVEGRPAVYVDGRKLDNVVRDTLESLADVREPDAFASDLAALGKAHKTVRLDQATAADALRRIVTDAGGKVVARHRSDHRDEGDQERRRNRRHARSASARRRGADALSGLARARGAAPASSARSTRSRALENFRRDTGALKDISFPTISGAGPNGAIVHYRVTEKTNRKIQPGELFLIDSGAQYEDGTTDMTRTVAVGTPTAEMRDRFTRVLKGHIAIARAVFPDGTNGAQLDSFARASSVAGRPRLRSRHRPRRRQLSVGA